MFVHSPTQALSVAGMVSRSKEVVKMSCMRLSGWTMLGWRFIGWACRQSFVCRGWTEGEPIADDSVLWTEAPESDVEESCGGCWRSKECEAELVGE